MVDHEVTRLSEALARPLERAYRLGGFGLTFLVLGATFLVASIAVPSEPLAYLVAAVGLLLIVVPCYFFYVKEIRPIKSAERTVRQNTELIDSVQETALEMTLAAHELQSLALANAREVEELLRLARPALSRIPVLSKIAESPRFDRADWFAGRVVAATERSEEVIGDIQRALTEADATQLRKYLAELRAVRTDLKELLRTGDEAPASGHAEERR